MSKTTLAATRLGGAGSDDTSCANGLAIVPHIIFKQLRTKICGKFIYVHVYCPEHKQLSAIARKSEKIVQELISNEEAS
jgi:hypothetical protein